MDINLESQHTHGRLEAPISVHGSAFGLYPVGGTGNDDLIDWHAEEFRNPEDARRLAACWNAFDGIPTEEVDGFIGELRSQIRGERASYAEELAKADARYDAKHDAMVDTLAKIDQCKIAMGMALAASDKLADDLSADRELLELAAKAVGIHVQQWNEGEIYIEEGGYPFHRKWNPLTDDIDALQLAVKLRMFLGWSKMDKKHRFVTVDVGSGDEFWEPIEKDASSATRRAIVRAAAEIGRRMS